MTKWVVDMTDRILCFVEDVIAHGIQQRLAHGITAEFLRAFSEDTSTEENELAA